MKMIKIIKISGLVLLALAAVLAGAVIYLKINAKKNILDGPGMINTREGELVGVSYSVIGGMVGESLYYSIKCQRDYTALFSYEYCPSNGADTIALSKTVPLTFFDEFRAICHATECLLQADYGKPNEIERLDAPVSVIVFSLEKGDDKTIRSDYVYSSSCDGLYTRIENRFEDVLAYRQENTDYSMTGTSQTAQLDKISGFHTEFFLADRWTAAGSHKFCFSIKPDETGVLTVYEDVAQISHPADEDILHKLQQIIAEYNLREKNGINDVTPGLAPGYQQCSLSAGYDSGENLQFSVNNDPHARWAEALYTAFADWFAQKSINDLFPAKETSLPVSIDMTYMENGKRYKYKSDSNMPDDYFEKAGWIIDSHNLVTAYDFSRYDHFAKDYGNHDRGYYGMGNRISADEKDADNIRFSLNIKYRSGRNIIIDTSKPSEIAGMTQFIAELMEYHNSVLETDV